MIRVWNTAGEEIASVPVEELTDVKSLKCRLQGCHGPPRFRQRLLSRTACLEDDARLESPVDLQLVTLPYCSPSEDQSRDLRAATLQGRIDLVEQILQRPQHPDSLPSGEPTSETPLFWAWRWRQGKVAALLLEARADTGTLLVEACKDGADDFVLLFLQAGADPNKAAGDGIVPLAAAAGQGRVELVKLLLESRANVDAPSPDEASAQGSRQSPLAAAAGKGHDPI